MRTLIHKRTIKSSAGFTLIEMAIVVMLFGLLIASLMPLYSLYQKNQNITATQTHVNAAVNAIGGFRSLHGRYPCPASLTANRNDPNYGREDCRNLMVAPNVTAVGACRDGVCVEQSKRAALTYNYPVGTPRNQSPRVLVGTIPFRQLNLEEDQAYDGYNDRIMYVVTEHLTCADCFEATQGGIDVLNDSGDSVLPTPGSSHFLVFSYGENNDGAFTKSGVQVACDPAGLDSENCNYITNPDATYQIARGSTSGDNLAFDDVVNYFSRDELPLWQMPTSADPDARRAINPKTAGGVAFNRVSGAVMEEAEVGGAVRTTEDPSDPGSGKFLLRNEFCEEGGTGCFPPSLIGGDISDATGGMQCPPSAPYMAGIRNGGPICIDDVVGECEDPDDIMIGIGPDGTVECTNYTAPCPTATVDLCPGILPNTVIPSAPHGQTVQTTVEGASRQRSYRCDSVNFNPPQWQRVSGSIVGVCACTPGVVSVTPTSCGSGWTGDQITTVVRTCPDGETTETVDTSACICAQDRGEDSRGCPPGHSGAILTERFHQCPAGTWTNWTDVPNGNSCTCANSTNTRDIACPGLQTGRIYQSQTVTCTTNGVTYGNWSETHRTCACSSITDEYPISCGDGFMGTIIMTRTLQCPNGTWGPSSEVSRDCRAIEPVYCAWVGKSTPRTSSSRPPGVNMEGPCKCSDVSQCYYRGNGTYTGYDVCACE